MVVASGGRNWSHESGVPSRGLAQQLKQHLCSCCGWPRAQELAHADPKA